MVTKYSDDREGIVTDHLPSAPERVRTDWVAPEPAGVTVICAFEITVESTPRTSPRRRSAGAGCCAPRLEATSVAETHASWRSLRKSVIAGSLTEVGGNGAYHYGRWIGPPAT